MDRKSFFVALAMAVVIFIAVVRLQRQPPPTARGPVYAVKERRVDGHPELSTEWLPLDGLKGSKGERVRPNWQSLVNADPKKPAFVFSLRYGTPDTLAWDAQKPATLDVDGRIIELPCQRGHYRQPDLFWNVVDCHGKLDDLKAAAQAKLVQFGFAGQTVDLGERGTAVLQELWRQAILLDG